VRGADLRDKFAGRTGIYWAEFAETAKKFEGASRWSNPVVFREKGARLPSFVRASRRRPLHKKERPGVALVEYLGFEYVVK
jgi:hypothetical protein